MNIAYITPSLANKGPVLVAQELVRQMIAHNHNCVVYYFDEKPDPISFECPVHHISKGEVLDFSSFDIVHSHGMRPDKYVAVNRTYDCNTRYISTIHNYVLQDFRYEYNWFVAQIFGRLWMRSLKKMDTIVALSDDAARYYRRWFKKEKLAYVYNTRNINTGEQLEQDAIANINQFKGDSTLIGVNCLLTKRKGVDLLIDALCDLPNYKLCVAGSGVELERLQAQAKRNKVDDRCLFLGYVSDAYRYLPFYDIYALPSRSEGFPLSLLEAAAYGVRCVVSDLPIIKECFAEGEVAIFELSQRQSLVAAIKRATADQQMGARLGDRFLRDYSPTKMYERYMKIYEG